MRFKIVTPALAVLLAPSALGATIENPRPAPTPLPTAAPASVPTASGAPVPQNPPPTPETRKVSGYERMVTKLRADYTEEYKCERHQGDLMYEASKRTPFGAGPEVLQKNFTAMGVDPHACDLLKAAIARDAEWLITNDAPPGVLQYSEAADTACAPDGGPYGKRFGTQTCPKPTPTPSGKP